MSNSEEQSGWEPTKIAEDRVEKKSKRDFIVCIVALVSMTLMNIVDKIF